MLGDITTIIHNGAVHAPPNVFSGMQRTYPMGPIRLSISVEVFGMTQPQIKKLAQAAERALQKAMPAKAKNYRRKYQVGSKPRRVSRGE